MDMAIAGDGRTDRIGAAERLTGIVAAVAAAILGYALAEAVTRAHTSDAFILPPTLGQVVGYVLTLAVAVGLALAFELGAPPLVAKGGHAARDLRALIRRRFRHGRSRAEIDNVEVGLTISVCSILLALSLVFATWNSILVVAIVGAVLLNLQALTGMCGLVGYAPGWSGLIGLLYGLAAGYVLT